MCRIRIILVWLMLFISYFGLYAEPNDSTVLITATELKYLDGVTSNVQTQLNGKAATNHGNHVPATQIADSATFLRNDNSWQKVTPYSIGAAPESHTHSEFTWKEF